MPVLKGHSVKSKCMQRFILSPNQETGYLTFENRSPVIHCTFQTRDMDKNITTDFSFNILPFLWFVFGKPRLPIFIIVLTLVVSESKFAYAQQPWWLCSALLIESTLIAFIYFFIHLSMVDYGQAYRSVLSTILVFCLEFKFQAMAELSVRCLWAVWPILKLMEHWKALVIICICSL